METQNFIGGQWITPKNNSVIVTNPSNTKEEIGTIHFSDRDDVLGAEKAAKHGFDVWSKMTSTVRANYLYKMADALEQHADELANLSSREMGKPITEMRGEVQRGVNLLRYYAAEGVRSNGDIIPATDSHVLQYTKRVPLGVVGVITPWNFPVAIPIWKIAPALICGNAVIWKPAEIASLTATRIMEIFETVNLPDGVLNLVVGKGSEIGNTLVEEVDINALSFTGSTSTGLSIASLCAKRNIKYQTEMGGKNAAVVLKDADLEHAIPAILSGAFRSAGQKCTATSRIIVEEAIYASFIEQIKQAVGKLNVTNALDSDAYLGPVASQDQYDKVTSYVQLAQSDADIIVEGDIQTDEDGYFIKPMVVTGLSSDHRLVQEEIFGPLAAVLKASDFDDAVALCNETVYGLSASLFTNDLSKAHRFLEEAEAGMVRVNQETAGVEYQAPFGGMKRSSSHSREQGQAALDFYSTTKTCAIKYTFG